MLHVHRHNSALRSRLVAAIESGHPEQLAAVMTQLSHSESRTAGYLLSEELLTEVLPAGEFPTWFLSVVPLSPKAYLGTFLKAALRIYAYGNLSLSDKRWEEYAEAASAIDKKKWLEAFLPKARNTEDVARLLQLFSSGTPEGCGPYLLQAGTTPAYYHLFCELRKQADDTDFITRYYYALVKKGDKHSYNLASIIKQYFGMVQLKGNFSLRIQPWELSRLELTPETFAKILES